jgi:AraC-like DNA-binding protein
MSTIAHLTPTAHSESQVQLLLRQAELVQRLAALTPRDGEQTTPVPGLSLWRLSAPSEPHHGLHKPAICVIAQGAKRLYLADELYDYDASHHLVVSQSLPVMGQVLQATEEQPYLCVRLDIDTVALAEQARHLSAPPMDGRSCTRGVFVGHNSVELLDPVLRLLRLMESPQHLPALAPLVLQEILYRLLSGPEGWRLAQTLTGGAGGGSAARIAQAINWLRERYAEPLSIAAMAEAAHMSPSSLHHHFKAVTAMSPLQYQKRLRLQEARCLLLGGGIDAASAAHKVGYQSPSQFSREYSRMFGAPPARDLRELKEQALGLAR